MINYWQHRIIHNTELKNNLSSGANSRLRTLLLLLGLKPARNIRAGVFGLIHNLKLIFNLEFLIMLERHWHHKRNLAILRSPRHALYATTHLSLLDPQMYKISQIYKCSLTIKIINNCINHPQMYKKVTTITLKCIKINHKCINRNLALCSCQMAGQVFVCVLLPWDHRLL